MSHPRDLPLRENPSLPLLPSVRTAAVARGALVLPFLCALVLLNSGCDRAWNVRGRVFEYDDRSPLLVVGEFESLKPVESPEVEVYQPDRQRRSYRVGSWSADNVGKFMLWAIDHRPPERLKIVVFVKGTEVWQADVAP